MFTKFEMLFGFLAAAAIAVVYLIGRAVQLDTERAARFEVTNPEDRSAEKRMMAEARNRVNEAAFRLPSRQPRVLQDWEFDAFGL